MIEIRRRAAPFVCGPDVEFSRCAPGYSADGLRGTRMKDFNPGWMVIPFFLMGMAEVLVNPSLYALAYDEAPLKVRSVIQAFQLFANGCISNAFTAIVSKKLFPDDLDKGHLEYFYYANIVFALLGIFLYTMILRCSKNHGSGDCLKDVADNKSEEVSNVEDTQSSTSNDFRVRCFGVWTLLLLHAHV